jgi:hypothetical protein
MVEANIKIRYVIRIGVSLLKTATFLHVHLRLLEHWSMNNNLRFLHNN